MSTTSCTLSLLEKAKDHMRNDQVLAAYRLLQQMPPPTTAEISKKEEDEETVAFLQEVETKAVLIQKIIDDLLTDPEIVHKEEGTGATTMPADTDPSDATTAATTAAMDDVWIKQGESHGHDRDTIMYYQVTEDLQLKCRLETPIESSLLVPLLSVLCETDLYTSWLPQWTIPRIGLASVDKLAQLGRTEQIVQFVSQVPWPFQSRDAVIQTVACDDIDDIEGGASTTTGSIVIGLHSLAEGDIVHGSTVCNEHYKNEKDTVIVPPVAEGLKRAEVDGGLLIRKCPDDHITLQGSTVHYPPDEHLILVGFSLRIDGKISPLFPKSIINFVIKVLCVCVCVFCSLEIYYCRMLQYQHRIP